MDDASVDVIHAHDIEHDKAHIALEKLDEFEAELSAALIAAQGEIAQRNWREASDAHHQAGVAFSETLEAAIAALDACRKAHADLWAAGRDVGLHLPECYAPIAINRESLEMFRRNLEQARDAELARRERANS